MHIQTSDQEKLGLGFGGYSCNWGTHICGFYETDHERDEVIFGFLRQGLRDGDYCLGCTVEQDPREFAAALRAGLAKHGENLDIVRPRQLYYPDGTFSPRAMDRVLSDYYAKSQSHGRRHTRGAAEMAWALEAIPGVELLMVYESRLNYFIPGKPWVSICLYDLRRFSGATVMAVLQTHPYMISQRTLLENPYYQSPNDWLLKNAPEYLDRAA